VPSDFEKSCEKAVFFVLSVESFGDDTTTSLITASLLVPTEGIAAVAATKGM
jgi:hypothetical protein